MTTDAVACSSEQTALGEGARWDARRDELLGVDILAGRVYRERISPDGVSCAFPGTKCQARVCQRYGVRQSDNSGSGPARRNGRRRRCPHPKGCAARDVMGAAGVVRRIRPGWNSAVEAVRKTSAAENGVVSTYVMERELPTGRAVNQLEVVASERPRELAVRTTAGPTPFLYRYGFSTEKGETVVRLDAEVELPGGATLLPPIARRLVKNGVDANFATLKQILEATRR
jgi:hypothetical protein